MEERLLGIKFKDNWIYRLAGGIALFFFFNRFFNIYNNYNIRLGDVL
ncbi:hypothetical protein [Caldisalinibacter kiritimatiensis]|uniref:Uncharacterized protein n=1 Tax=Caldisalinibacter kiritimatiensis TaxID=1304284 RepID=R1CKS3_9FIRM|nr:hypothetical protein [Caldisalinibacter kiritimatiensis]EOC99325.1 hypothetical protein L21TH_2649 [Caldisalinibacter kiritimatiensis]